MFDALEQKFKNTDQADLISRLYEGKLKDYVKCLEVSASSSKLFRIFSLNNGIIILSAVMRVLERTRFWIYLWLLDLLDPAKLMEVW